MGRAVKNRSPGARMAVPKTPSPLGGAIMNENPSFAPKTFAVIGAGPVGCIVAAFLEKGGYEVILCDVVPDLLEPAKERGIIIEGAENLTQKVSHTCSSVDDLPGFKPDVIVVTAKANALPLIASAIEGFHKDGLYVVSWQNGIDTELVLANSLGKASVLRAVVNYGCGLLGPAHAGSVRRHTRCLCRAHDRDRLVCARLARGRPPVVRRRGPDQATQGETECIRRGKGTPRPG